MIWIQESRKEDPESTPDHNRHKSTAINQTNINPQQSINQSINQSNTTTTTNRTSRGFHTNQLFIQLSSRRNTQSTNKLLEIDSAIFIVIKDIEDVICKARWIAKGEELFVYFLEFGFVEGAGGAIF